MREPWEHSSDSVSHCKVSCLKLPSPQVAQAWSPPGSSEGTWGGRAGQLHSWGCCGSPSMRTSFGKSGALPCAAPGSFWTGEEVRVALIPAAAPPSPTCLISAASPASGATVLLHGSGSRSFPSNLGGPSLKQESAAQHLLPGLRCGWPATLTALCAADSQMPFSLIHHLPSPGAPGLSCWLLACLSSLEQFWEPGEEEEGRR